MRILFAQALDCMPLQRVTHFLTRHPFHNNGHRNHFVFPEIQCNFGHSTKDKYVDRDCAVPRKWIQHSASIYGKLSLLHLPPLVNDVDGDCVVPRNWVQYRACTHGRLWLLYPPAGLNDVRDCAVCKNCKHRTCTHGKLWCLHPPALLNDVNEECYSPGIYLVQHNSLYPRHVITFPLTNIPIVALMVIMLSQELNTT